MLEYVKSAHDRLYIDGEWSAPRDGRLVEVINPVTEEPIAQAALGGPADIDRAVRAARAAFEAGPWAESTASQHAAKASTFPWEEEREGVLGPILVRRPPVGVVGAIVPWNYPLGLSFPKLSPALLTGCTVILKPPDVLNVVAADREVSEELVRHPLVDKISFTGSTRAGRRIAALCGERLKRCGLELGGKSAAILLPGADLDTVIPALAPSTMANNGQTCVNQTRVLAPLEA